MKNHWRAVLLFVMALFLLSGCSASLNEELDEALMTTEEAFIETPKETNKQNADIEYYLPFGFEIEEETESNIILKNGSKTYILFYNLHEDSKSDIVLKATLQQKEYDVDERFQTDDKLGFFLLKQISNKENELTIGLGGVKVTSEVKTKNLKTEAETMMMIANSVKEKK